MALHAYVRQLITNAFHGEPVSANELVKVQSLVKAGEKTGPALTELKEEIYGDTSEDIQTELRKIRDSILAERKKKGGRRLTRGSSRRARGSRRR
jgi:hypothetical protein